MRIAFVYSKFPPVEDGGADYLEHLGRALAKQGHEIVVLTSSSIPTVEAKELPFRVYPIIANWKLPVLGGSASWQTLQRAVSSFRPDVIQVIFPDSTLGADYQLPYLISQLDRRIPVVTLFFSFTSSSSNLFGKLGVAAMLFGSRAIFIHSEQLLNEFTRRLPVFRGKSHLVPVGNNLDGAQYDNQDRDSLRQQRGWSDTEFHLGFYGAMDPSKGIDTLLEALALLLPDYPQLRLHFIGGRTTYQSGYPSEVEVIVKQRRLEQVVSSSGYLSKEEVCHQLRACDVCVLPFKRNALGRSSLVSALSLGVPVITTRLTERSAYFCDNQNVLLVAPSDPLELSRAITRLMLDAPLRQRLSLGGKLLAERLSWQAIAARSVEIYETLEHKNRKPA